MKAYLQSILRSCYNTELKKPGQEKDFDYANVSGENCKPLELCAPQNIAPGPWLHIHTEIYYTATF